jgi:hypothetical protein
VISSGNSTSKDEYFNVIPLYSMKNDASNINESFSESLKKSSARNAAPKTWPVKQGDVCTLTGKEQQSHCGNK